MCVWVCKYVFCTYIYMYNTPSVCIGKEERKEKIYIYKILKVSIDNTCIHIHTYIHAY